MEDFLELLWLLTRTDDVDDIQTYKHTKETSYAKMPMKVSYFIPLFL